MTKKEERVLAHRELTQSINLSSEYCLKFTVSEADFIQCYGKKSFIRLAGIGTVMVINRCLHEVRVEAYDTDAPYVIVEVTPLRILRQPDNSNRAGQL